MGGCLEQFFVANREVSVFFCCNERIVSNGGNETAVVVNCDCVPSFRGQGLLH
jgi:hypothetical protein